MLSVDAAWYISKAHNLHELRSSDRTATVASNDKSASELTWWQFTLGELMIATAIFAAVLGFAAWLGPLGPAYVLTATGVCLLGLGIHRRRKRFAVFAGICLLLAVVDGGLFYFGPQSAGGMICLVCRERYVAGTFAGFHLPVRDIETDLSKWYRQAGLRPHKHRWEFDFVWWQDWGGGRGSSFRYGEELPPLEMLKDAQEKVNRATFEALVEDYYATVEDPKKIAGFRDKCRNLGVQ
jgi:hypothetical protein